MKIFMGIAALVVAILISFISAYFSIVGLAMLFQARAISVIFMATSLEIGKLVAATWLKLNWKEKSVHFLHKAYLLVAVLVLMVITSIGIFGHLSAGHLEQNAPLAGLSIQQQQYQVQLDQTNATNKRIEGRLAQIDANINTFLTSGAASKGLRASNSLKQEREKLQTQMDENNKQINDLNTKLAPLKQQSTEVEAKLGPIKYLASAAGYNDPEVAVRMVIILIMIAFDPLAVILMLSAMATFNMIADDKIKVIVTEPEPTPLAEPNMVFETVFENLETPEDDFTDRLLEKEGTIPKDIDLDNYDAFTESAIIEGGDIPVVISGNGTIENTPRRLSSREIANMMAEKPKSPKVPETLPDDPKEIRNLLIDLMEQYPDLVNDLVATAKEIETDGVPKTTSSLTGGSVD